jgi:hypothetical protein
MVMPFSASTKAKNGKSQVAPMLALHETASKAVTVILERKCEYFPGCQPIATQLTLFSHCVDADRTYDVSLALESEDEHAHTDEEDQDHNHAAESTTETTADADHKITEVTDCHAHADVLYCMVGSEEWEVTTDVDVDNAPDAYNGCHAHGEDELYATSGCTCPNRTR